MDFSVVLIALVVFGVLLGYLLYNKIFVKKEKNWFSVILLALPFILIFGFVALNVLYAVGCGWYQSCL